MERKELTFYNKRESNRFKKENLEGKEDIYDIRTRVENYGPKMDKYIVEWIE